MSEFKVIRKRKTRDPNKTVVDMHIHTIASPCGKITLEETLALLTEKVDAVTVTDHDIVFFEPESVLDSYMMKYHLAVFCPSYELTTNQGDLLIYGFPEVIPKMDAQQAIEIIHSEGGIVVAAHPFEGAGLGELVYNLDLDAIEINGSRTANANQEARTAAETMGLPLVGGSDSHMKTQVGTCATEFPVRIRTLDELLECIKRGHCKPIFLGQPVF